MTIHLANLHQISFEFVASSKGKEVVIEVEMQDIDIDIEDVHVILEDVDLVV